MLEVETFFLRQPTGNGISSITLREVIVKLLTHNGHSTMRERAKYGAERIKRFPFQQEDPIVHVME